MKALIKKEAAEGLWLADVPMPTIGDRDVLIRIRQAAICGTDVHIWKWDEWAAQTVPVGLTVGHEYVGVVEAFGREVTHLKVGQRVSGEGHIVCGHCRNCRAGRRHLCAHTLGVGIHRPGAFAEFLSLPMENVVPVPDDIPDEVAAIFDPLGNAVHTALSFDLVGEDVLITGAGPIGIMAIAIANASAGLRLPPAMRCRSAMVCFKWASFSTLLRPSACSRLMFTSTLPRTTASPTILRHTKSRSR